MAGDPLWKLWNNGLSLVVYVQAVSNLFIFRFHSKEDREAHSPLQMEGKKLLPCPWAPGQDETSWPSEALVWIRLSGIPYHYWSNDILLSIVASIGKPLRLDDITAKQDVLFC